MAKINIKIEGIPFQVDDGLTVSEAAKQCGFDIPTLCHYNHSECSVGSCRVCLVEVSNENGLVASCMHPVSEGMEITVSSPKATAARRTSVELLLSNHNENCQQCDKNGYCELLRVAKITGARTDRYSGERSESFLDDCNPSIVRDTSKCILCGRCIERCKNVNGVGVLNFEKQGFNLSVTPTGCKNLADSPCTFCGQCVSVCPTGALMEVSEIDKVDAAMKAGKYVVVQTAPSIRTALGEEFGMPIGSLVTGKMVAALRRLGFKKVFDTNFGADLTVMEEASELLARIQNGGVLPMITSCCPAWVNYAEYHYGDLLPHLSSCKSPHQMFGAILKSYYCAKNGIDPKDMFVVSVMPCTAKKAEKERAELCVNGLKDVDAVLTTRELGKLIRRSGIRFAKLPDEPFDNDIVGEYTGAGVIFGASGGVMEAALRTATYKLTGEELKSPELRQVRGLEGIKDATFRIGGKEIKVAVAQGMKNAKVLLDQIREGKSEYLFIEVMACPGGCIAGGGQPYVRPCFLPDEDDDIADTFRAKRASALYREDESKVLRASHKNPQITELYKQDLGEPDSHKAHELLHTVHTPKEKKEKLPLKCV